MNNTLDQTFGRRVRSILAVRPRLDDRQHVPAAVGASDAELVRLAARPIDAELERARVLTSVYGGHRRP